MVATAEWAINARHAPPPDLVDALRRQRLFAIVEEYRHRRLLLLQAPAGFGKTVFLSQWHDRVRASGALAAWVSLEASDASGDALVAALALALVRADLVAADDIVLPSADHSPMAALDALGSVMQGVRRETWLFIDNWHLAQSGDAPALLEPLLRRLPANCHIALASRTPPRLTLAAYRASGQIVEIGAGELRFSDQEASDLLSAADCPPGILATILETTHGWPIAVKLASLGTEAFQGLDRSGFSSIIDAIDGMDDYLDSEIFSSLTYEIRDFLLDMSICHRFSRDLADHVRDAGDTPQMLDALKPLRGLVDPVGQSNDWLSIHPLFAAFLETRRRAVDVERLRGLHRRAADWFEGRGQLNDAIGHALESGDQARSIRLVESANCLDICIRTGAPAVRSLLDKLPQEVIRERPRLRAAHAALNLKRGSIAEARSLMSELRQGLRHGGNDWALERDVLILENLSLCFIDTSPSAEEIATYRRDLESDYVDEWWIDALRYNVYGRLEMRAGHLKEAHEALQRAFEILEAGGSAHGCFFMSIHIAFCHLFLGKLSAAEDAVRIAQTILERDLDGEFLYACIAYSAKSLLAYERNELAEAGRLAQLALAGLEQAEGCFEQYLVSVYVGARCAFALSGLDAALEIISRGRKLALFHGLHVMDRILVGMTAGFHARAGQWRSDAIARLDTAAAQECGWLEADLSAPAHSLIARHEERRSDARQIAAATIRRSRAAGRVPTEIRAHLSLALICAEDGDTPGAQEALCLAVGLASQEALFQPFFEADDQLLRLLRELSKSAATRLSPFTASFLSSLVLRLVATRKARDHGETLTAREREILLHLTDGMSRKEIISNKEIARALDLTENAVKFHLKNVFRKLDVQNRDMAAAVARLLGSNVPGPATADGPASWPTHH